MWCSKNGCSDFVHVAHCSVDNSFMSMSSYECPITERIVNVLFVVDINQFASLCLLHDDWMGREIFNICGIPPGMTCDACSYNAADCTLLPFSKGICTLIFLSPHIVFAYSICKGK